jgi:hypothetical protein
VKAENAGRRLSRGCREILRAEAATPCNAIMGGRHAAFHRRGRRDGLIDGIDKTEVEKLRV